MDDKNMTKAELINELAKAHQRIGEFEEQEYLKTIFDSIYAGIVVIDAETHVITDANPAAIKMIGAPKEKIVGKVCHKFICPAEEDKCPVTDLRQTIDNREWDLINANGGAVPILKTVASTMIKGRKHLIESFMDITVRKKMEEKLEKRTHDLGERVKELDCLYGISNLVEKPDISWEEILKGTVNLISRAWQYPEITCARIVLNGRDIRTENFKETIWKQTSYIIVHDKQVGTLEVCYLEQRLESDEGPFLKQERSLINAIAEELGRTVERKKAEEEIRYLSFYDPLTDLYNRRYFENEMKRLNYSRDLPIGIIMADIDGFKKVNDTFGHKEGDRLLQNTAKILKSVTRKGDILARIGGDEFAVILPNIDSKTTVPLCDRIKKAFHEHTNKKKLNVDISVGCALKKDKNTNLEDVLIRADQCMYQAKRSKMQVTRK